MITLGGPISSALTHLAGYGLGAILQESGARCVRLSWRDAATPALELNWDGDVDPAEAVHAHAERHTRPESWVQALVEHDGKQAGLFSPRLSKPKTQQAWDKLISTRRDFLDRDSTRTWLDDQMIGALGEPAFWLETDKESNPDQGASRWEMKTRNRGEDFVRNRLAPLARIVAARQSGDVFPGLTGETCRDELGNNSPGSFTPTGLQPPSPVDNSLAWCALWGISQMPLVPQARHMSQTAGSWRRGRVHPDRFLLPVPTTPLSLPKLSAVLASVQFDIAVVRNDILDPLKKAAAARWLVERGIEYVIVFPVEIAGSSSAPERRLLSGVVTSVEG